MVAHIVDSMTGPLNRQTTILFICSIVHKHRSKWCNFWRALHNSIVATTV